MKAQKDPLIVLPAYDFERTMATIIETIHSYQSQTNQANWKYGFRNKQESVLVYVRWLWTMARAEIKYKLDAPLKEEIRTPSRTWYDRKTGVDCEDYCIFLSTILLNSKIKHSLRVADYGGGWSHIYIVVKDKNTNIILDAVNPVFDTEKPFVAKKDYPVKPSKGLSGIEEEFRKQVFVKPTKFKTGDYVKLYKDYEGVIDGVNDFTIPSYFIKSYDGELFIQSESTIVISTKTAFESAVNQYKKGFLKSLKITRKERNENDKSNKGYVNTKTISKFTLNQEIETLLDTKKVFSADELNYLRNYSGSGGKAKDGATGEGLLYEFYTPDWIAALMWEIATVHGYQGGNVLETSCGTGVFFDTAPENLNHSFVGFEVNPYSAKIAQLRHPKATIYNQYFETAFLDPQTKFRSRIKLRNKEFTWLKQYPFDLVIGNPPYGIYQNQYSPYFPELKRLGIKQMELAFMYWGLSLLKSGSLLVYITSQNLLRTGFAYQQAKETIGKMADLVDAYRLPAVFDSSQVPTDILVFRKK